MIAPTKVYEGHAESLQKALENAHAQIPVRNDRDFTISKVVEWGMQYGGFTLATLFYVKVIEDETAHFKTDK